jgi:hypothetical protein
VHQGGHQGGQPAMQAALQHALDSAVHTAMVDDSARGSKGSSLERRSRSAQGCGEDETVDLLQQSIKAGEECYNPGSGWTSMKSHMLEGCP